MKAILDARLKLEVAKINERVLRKRLVASGHRISRVISVDEARAVEASRMGFPCTHHRLFRVGVFNGLTDWS